MEQQEGLTNTRSPLFHGDNYAFWKIRMRSHLMALGFGVWRSVVKGYDEASSESTNVDEKAYTNDAKALNAILNGLGNSVFVKVMHCKTSKEIWDKLESIYEGDAKVKGEKLQTYKA